MLDLATLGLRVDASQVREADRALDRLGRTGARTERAADGMSNAMQRLAKMAAAVASALAVIEAVQLADEMALMDARLKLATKSSQEFVQAQKAVYDIAQKNRVALGAVAELFTKLSDPVRAVGGGMREITGIVDAFSTTLRISGASSEAASSAITQFAQAMGRGSLSGDEFNSIAEASPRLLKALAEGMGVPTAQLKAMGSEGKLTADVVGNALLKALGQLNKEAATLPETVGGAFQKVKNDIAVAVRDINNSISGTTSLAGLIEAVRPLIPMVRDELVRAFVAVESWVVKNRDAINEIASRAVVLVGQVWELAKAFGAVAGSVVEAGVQFGVFKAALTGAALLVAGLQDGVKLVSASFVAVGGSILEFVLKPMLKVLDSAARVAGLFDDDLAAKIGGVAEEIRGALKGAGDYVRGVERDFETGNTAVNRLMRDLYGAESATLSLATSGNKVAEAFTKLKPPAGTVDEKKKKEYEKAVKAANDFIEAQKREAAQIGMTDRQQIMYNAARAAALAPTQKLKEEIILSAEALWRAKEAQDGLNASQNAVTADAQNLLDLQARAKALELEIQLYGKGEKAYTMAEAAKTRAKAGSLAISEEYRAQLIKEAEALERIATLQGLKSDLDDMFEVDKVQSFGDALRDAFGSAGDGLAKLGNEVQDYFEKEEKADKARAKAKLKYGDDDKKLTKEIGKINAQQERDRINAYANMAGAAKGFFKEKTVGYKVLEAAEKGFRLYELAMNAQVLAAKLTATTVATTAGVSGNAAVAASATTSAATQVGANMAVGASAAVAGVANQAKGDPYTAFGRMAAMAAIMVGLGFAVRASGKDSSSYKNSAEYVQKTQGTGSVFGDDSAKSDSIKKSLALLEENSDLMLPLTQGMLASLRSIDAAMNGLSNIVIRSVGLTTGENMSLQTGKQPGNGMNFLQNTLMGTNSTGGAIAGLLLGGPIGAVLGAIGGKILGKLWGSVTQDITDSGLMFGGRVSDLQNGNGFNQYANVKTTKKSFFGLKKSTSDRLATGALDEDVSKQFGLVFKNLETVLKSAATGLGMDANAVGETVRNFIIDTTKLSLKDLKGDELQEAISAVLSKATDDIAATALPGFDEFRQVGEGYAETVIRVASGVEVAGLQLERFGIAAIKYSDITNKQGDVAAEIVRESILAVDGMGGVADIMRTLGGSAEELADTYAELLATQAQMRMVGVDPAALGVSLIRAAGGLDALQSGLDDYFDGFFTEAEQIAAKTEAMRAKFSALGVEMPTTVEGFRALVESTPALTGQLLGLAGGLSELLEATDSQAAEALELSNTKRGMEAQIMRLQGNEAGALAIERALELEGMEESLRPLQARIYALEDESAALELANTRRGLEAEIMRLQGNEAGALAIERAIELASMDESLRPLKERVWALEDEKKAIEDAEKARMKAADDAFKVLQRAINAEKEAKNKAYDEQIKGFDKAIEATRVKMTKLTAISQAISGAADQVGLPDADRAGAQASLQSMLAIARAGGVLTLDEDQLKRSLSVLSQDSSDMFGSARDYEFDRYQTAIALGELSELTDGALSIEERSLKELEDAKELAKRAHEEDIARLDGILNNAQLQLDALKGVDVSVKSVEQALRGFIASTEAVTAGRAAAAAAAASIPTTAPGASTSADALNRAAISNLYSSVLGRAADAAGLDFWASNVARGATTIDQVEALMKTSEEYIRQVASNEEARAVTMQSSAALVRQDAAALDGASIVKAVETMQTDLKGALVAIASYTQRTAQTNEDMERRERQNEETV